MLKLLKIEWLKIRKYRAFIILLGFFALSVFGINYIAYSSLRFLGEAEASGGADINITGVVFGSPFNYPTVWHTVSYLCSYLLFIPGLLIIMLTANEYSFKTHRQAIIDGMSRTQFILGKICLIGVISLVLTLYVAVLSLLFGLAGDTSFSLKGIEYLGYFFIQSVSYMSVAFVLVMIFKRSGVSIGIYFLYAFIVENMVSAVLNYKVSSGLGNFLPIKAADKLITAPTALGKMINLNPTDTKYLLPAAAVWIGLCLWFSMFKFRKSDL